MGYNEKEILKDNRGLPIPQIWDDLLDEFIPFGKVQNVEVIGGSVTNETLFEGSIAAGEEKEIVEPKAIPEGTQSLGIFIRKSTSLETRLTVRQSNDATDSVGARKTLVETFSDSRSETSLILPVKGDEMRLYLKNESGTDRDFYVWIVYYPQPQIPTTSSPSASSESIEFPSDLAKENKQDEVLQQLEEILAVTSTKRNVKLETIAGYEVDADSSSVAVNQQVSLEDYPYIYVMVYADASHDFHVEGRFRVNGGDNGSLISKKRMIEAAGEYQSSSGFIEAEGENVNIEITNNDTESSHTYDVHLFGVR